MRLRVISCGEGHGPAPDADITVAVARWFRDPHVSARMRSMNGLDPLVEANVLGTRGVPEFLDRLFAAAAVLVAVGREVVTVTVQCVGGRHRSVVFAEQLGCRARAAGWHVEVVHRDIDKPVLTGRRGSDGISRR